ncbi:MAG: von Willebrand factor type A domain-containing protein [Bacteroidota bacterium]|nr:von Willebrand factor type A domain-containing protein [Bacteroidota bacterium]
MKKLFAFGYLLLSGLALKAQYYIRGEVRDPAGVAIQNVKIYMPSTRSLYYSGITGGFGIPSPLQYDSLIFSAEGYETRALRIRTDAYQEITLKLTGTSISTRKRKLASMTHGAQGNVYPVSYYQDESYANIVENDFVSAGHDYTTSLAMRIDKASYSNIRRFLNQDTRVPPDAVRIDEMLNYFNFNYQQPGADSVFGLHTHYTSCPWDTSHRLLFVNLSGKKLNLDKVPPTNLVFLIDVSGSMDLPNRLPLLKEAFQLLVNNLRKKDTVSIVVYGGSVGIWLQPTSGDKKEKITQAIEALQASGDTPGEAAIRTAYSLAEHTFIKGGNNRIILATDGDFNIGQTSEKDLEELITKERQSGVYLTCLGVGMGNYKDSKIEVLSKKGNGNFAYLDDLREADKVLVTEFTQTLYSIASDVYLSIKFNPDLVSSYRLIGYDNRREVLAEKGEELEGGEIGSGAGNTAVFEIIPATRDTVGFADHSLAHLTLHYLPTGDTLDREDHYRAPADDIAFDLMPRSLQFATAVVMTGLKLRQSAFFPEDLDWDEIRQLAVTSAMPGNYLQNEFIGLLDKCKNLYPDRKRRRWKTRLFGPGGH